ncbi:MAG: Gfo/Idh/MocA family protein [Candidatus Bipolaricaulia bacterium]
MSDILGVGLVGCGQIVPRHVQAIGETAGIEVRAVCDVDRNRCDAWSTKLKVPGFGHIDDLLRRRDVDLVALCTPNHLHVPMARAALAAGKHAVVEKPLAFSRTEALELGRAFREAGLGLFSVLQVRFNPAVQAVLDLVRRGGLGRLYVGSMTQRWNRGPAYFDGADNWHGKKALEGGALFTQGIHYIDLLIQLAGPIVEVSARAATLAHAIETEDAAVAHVRFANGALGVIEFSLDVYPRNLEASLTLIGEEGTIVVGGIAANELTLWNVKTQPAPTGLAAATPNDYGGAYVGSPPNHGDIYRNVVAHLRDGEPIAVPAESAAEAIRVIEAIYESARTGRAVTIPREGS